MDENNYLEVNKETYNKSAGFAEANMKKNSQTYGAVMEHLNKHIDANKSILELGPGNGYMLKLLSEQGHHVVGLEFSPERAKLARKTAPNAEVKEVEFLTHDFGGDKYDVIVALEFLHLFPPEELDKLLKKIVTLLKGNGLTVFSTTLNTKSEEGYQRRTDGLVRYRRRFTTDELKDLLDTHGLKTIDYFEINTIERSGDILMNFICRKQNS